MGAGYLVISAASTVLSYVGLYYWAELPLSKLKFGDLMNENLSGPETLKHDVELLQGSYLTIALLANFVFNVFILLNICLKTMFFAKLYPAESRKLVERLVNYVIYKGTFLPLVIPPTLFSLGLWSTWLTVVCSLKMFQALARDRLERLNASPSAIPCRYFRVYSALLFVLSADLYWIRLCFEVYRSLGSSVLLLFFEPLSIAFETLQAMLIHGFQLLDILSHHTQGENAKCKRLKFFDKIKSAGSLSEWKGILIRNWGFSLDMGTLLMALGHYVHIWWLKGIAFHLVDAVLFLNIRALLGAIIKRIKGFMKMKIALGTLHAALPDATSEELRAYDDECAICREPMAKAKKLQCNHLFHLACLRSWLDQGLSDNYSCPTCRKPLFFSRPTNNPHLQNREVLSDEQLARQISEGLNRNIPGHSLPLGVMPNQIQNSIEGNPWRSADLDSSWLDTWPAQGLDVPGSSTSVRPVGLGRVQMMMRHLASVGETYAQTTLEDTSWNLWPSVATTSGNPIPHNVGGRYPGAMGVRHTRTASLPVIDNMANVLAMAETVRDVLPHVPDELIVQDLQRTNSVAVTVNNLLQM